MTADLSPRELLVAMVTPFDASAQVDTDKVATHARWLVDQGVDGLVPTGTTGEFLYLSAREKAAMHAAVLRAVGDQTKVVPHVWDPDPHTAASLAQAAESGGAWGVLCAPPLYQPVSDDTLMRWYALITRAVNCPVLAYHHPRTHNPLSATLLDRLVEAGVYGMKDSSVDPDRVRVLAEAHPGRVWAGGCRLLGNPDLGPVAGHISRVANLYPGHAVSIAHAEGTEAIESGLHARLDAVDQAGGLGAIKVALGMGSRLPVGDCDEEAALSLPPPGIPTS